MAENDYDPADTDLARDAQQEPQRGYLWNDIKQTPWAEAGQDLARDAQQALGSFAPGAPRPGAPPKTAMPDMLGSLNKSMGQGFAGLRQGARAVGAGIQRAMEFDPDAQTPETPEEKANKEAAAAIKSTVTPADQKPVPPHHVVDPAAAKAFPEFIRTYASCYPEDKGLLEALMNVAKCQGDITDVKGAGERFRDESEAALKKTADVLEETREVHKLLSKPETFGEGQAKAQILAGKYPTNPVLHNMIAAGNFEGVNAQVRFLDSIQTKGEEAVAAQNYQNTISTRIAGQISKLYQGNRSTNGNSASAWFRSLDGASRQNIWNRTAASVQAEMQRETAALDAGDYESYRRGGMSIDDLRVNQLMRRDGLDHKEAAKKWNGAKLEADLIQKQNKTLGERLAAARLVGDEALISAIEGPAEEESRRKGGIAVQRKEDAEKAAKAGNARLVAGGKAPLTADQIDTYVAQREALMKPPSGTERDKYNDRLANTKEAGTLLVDSLDALNASLAVGLAGRVIRAGEVIGTILGGHSTEAEKLKASMNLFQIKAQAVLQHSRGFSTREQKTLEELTDIKLMGKTPEIVKRDMDVLGKAMMRSKLELERRLTGQATTDELSALNDMFGIPPEKPQTTVSTPTDKAKPAAPMGGSQVSEVTDKAAYDALPPGSKYRKPGDPPGAVRTKK